MTASIPPLLPIDVSDYLSKTQHFSPAEHGALLLLFIAYWNNDGPLLKSDKKLERITRMNGEEWKEVKESVLSMFENDHGYLRSRMLDDALKSAKSKRDGHRKGAEQTNLTRWGTDSPSDSLNDPDCRPEWERLFEDRFWPKYPKKVDKSGSKKTFKRIITHDKVPIDRILRGLDAWIFDDSWKKQNGTYIPYPTTWLNQRRWEAKLDFQPNAGSDVAAVRIMGKTYNAQTSPRPENFRSEVDYIKAYNLWAVWASKH